MAKTYAQYLTNGTQREFAVPFPYLSRDHIQITLDSGATPAFTWLNESLIQLGTAPLSGDLLDVRRITPRDTPMDFADGSILAAADLDLLAVYTAYMSEEALQSSDDALKKDLRGSFTAAGQRIKEVSQAVESADAVPLGQMRSEFSGAVDSASESAATALAAVETVSSVVEDYGTVGKAAADALAASNAAGAAANSANARATQAESARATAETARIQAQGAAISAGLALAAYASVGAGRAAVADGGTFWVAPNATDGITRYTNYRRTNATTSVFITDVLPAGEFDAKVSSTNQGLIALRDKTGRIAARFDATGAMAVPALEVGNPMFPQSEHPELAAVVRGDRGERIAELGLVSRFAEVAADFINGQDYSTFKPGRALRIVGDECYSGCLPGPNKGWKMNARKLVRFPKAAALIQFSFANTFWVGEAGGFPTADYALGTITVSGAVEHQGLLFQMTFNGAPSVTVPAGRTVTCDPLYIYVEDDTSVPLRMFVDPGAGYFPVGTPYFAADGVTYSAADTDQTMNLGYAYSRYTNNAWGPIAFGPIAVTGQSYDPARVVALIGDSIGQGSADSADWQTAGMGWAHRALSGAELILLNLSQQAESAAISTYSKGTYARWRWLNYADHAICELSVNDLNAGTPLATLQGHLVRIWKRARMHGCTVWQTTITPVTTSTDGFTTLAGQTASGSYAPGGTRVQLNEWIRAGAPLYNGQAVGAGTAGAIYAGHPLHPLTGYFELADAVESSRNSCLFAVNRGPLTADGVHPNALGHSLLALAVPTNRFI